MSARGAQRSNYRGVAPESQVDESLFGTRRSARARSAGQRVIEGAPPSNASYVSKSYLEDLKARAAAPTLPLGARQPSPATTNRRNRNNAQATLRKTRMAAVDEKQRKLAAAKAAKAAVDEENIRAQMRLESVANPALYAAHAAETEEQDEIKAFNIKVNRVRVLRTIGQQVEDKKEIERREVHLQRHMERRMNVDRTKALEIEAAAVREQRKRDKAAADELQQQLKEREFQRMIELERLELEGKQLAESIAKAAQEDKEAELARRSHSRKIMEETMQANIDAKKHKQELLEKERRTDRALRRYQARKDAEAQAKLEAEEKKRAEREKLFAKMRAEQERVMDKRGEEDEARARRYQEELILKDRAKVAEEERARAELMKEVIKSREIQQQLKEEERRREQEKDVMQQRILARKAREDYAREQEHARRVREVAARNQDDVVAQIRIREAELKRIQDFKFKEAEAIARKNAERELRIQMAKKAKLDMLAAEGYTRQEMNMTGLFADA